MKNTLPETIWVSKRNFTKDIYLYVATDGEKMVMLWDGDGLDTSSFSFGFAG